MVTERIASGLGFRPPQPSRRQFPFPCSDIWAGQPPEEDFGSYLRLRKTAALGL